jgi:transcriptional regulator with XRE-family HTH domain
MSTLRDRIMEYRAKNDLSQVQLAAALGVTVPTVIKIESGAMPSRLVIAKAAVLLGIPYTEAEKEAENDQPAI